MSSCLLQHPAWKWSGPIVKGKDKEKVYKKGRYKQQKKGKQVKDTIENCMLEVTPTGHYCLTEKAKNVPIQFCCT